MSERLSIYKIRGEKISPLLCLRLEVGILTGDVWDAGASLLGVEVVVTYDECTRIAAVKVL